MDQSDNSTIVFREETSLPALKPLVKSPWKILIIDDDEETHLVTRLALSEISIFDRGIEFLQAYNSEEAVNILLKHDDITVILLDIVMETETAGLDLIKTIREELQLASPRIIIRTGQPGYAPELKIIQEYDINDYKMKSELTRTRLLSSLISAIRSYEQYQTLAKNKNGMEHMITSSRELFTYNSITDYSNYVIRQINSIIDSDCSALICNKVLAADRDSADNNYFIIAASSYYRKYINTYIKYLDENLKENLNNLFIEKNTFFHKNTAYIYLENDHIHNGAIVVSADHVLTESEQQLLKVYGVQVSIGFENQYLLHQLHRSAYFDSLCDLPNRTSFLDEIRKRQKVDKDLSIALIDVIQFSEINNVMGYQHGDELLQSVARRILAHLDRDIFLARISGDTFSILGSKKKITPEKILSIFKEPFLLNGTSFPIKATLGIAEMEQPDITPEDVLQNADMALRIAKKTEGTLFMFYDYKMDQATQSRMIITRDLKNAIDCDDLILHFQPQFDLISEKLCGVEGLIRWQKQDGELIPPSSFIPIAEQSGLIINIGEIAIKKSLDFLNRWISEGNTPFRIGINVSVRQFHSDNFSSYLTDMIAESSIDPSYIELEITESILMHDFERGLKILNHAKSLGLSIAIDDFGTGFSSLSYLQKLPIDRLKIDRSFIMNLENDQKAQSLTQMIVKMAKQLKLEIIAEGVETVQQADFLKDLDCDEVQGYLYSKPLSKSDFQAWARKYGV